MSMTDEYFNHDRSVQSIVAHVNTKIMRQLLKHIQRHKTYDTHNWRKGTGLFVCVDRAPANNKANLRVAYCSSGKITYLNAQSFYNQRQEYYDLLDRAFNGTDTANQYKAPHEFLVTKVNSAPKA